MNNIKSNRPTKIVAIGASAGGIQALEKFFSNLGSDTGMGYVVIQHLSPDFKSLMNEILSRKTEMEVLPVEEDQLVEANKVYLITPNSSILIREGHLFIKSRDHLNKRHFVIDTFFMSLANDQGDKAIGIILSGTGSDGSIGIEKINKKGGLVFSQTIESSEFDGMPRNAINTGFCHCIANPEKLPSLLISLSKKASPPKKIIIHAEEAKNKDYDSTIEIEDQKIFELLKINYGVDFNAYKLPTISRRLNLRLKERETSSKLDYYKLLQDNEKEISALYHNLLIGVTEFFRDGLSFEYLEEEIIPRLFDKNRDEIRIWVIACATGEEAYSIAISFQIVADAMDYKGKISIFATDVDSRSIETASNGIYPYEKLKNLSNIRLEEFFTKLPDGLYKIDPNIRKQIVFSRHDALSDPAFTRINMISCRNFMIYLKKNTQEKLLSTIHFSLALEGYFFLGASESIRQVANDFLIISEKFNIAKKNPSINQLPPIPNYYKKPNLTNSLDLNYNNILRKRNNDKLIRDYDYILSKYTPTALIIDENLDIIQFIGNTSIYLKPESGRADKNLLQRTDGDLRLALATSLRKCLQKNNCVVSKGVKVSIGDNYNYVDITIDPIPLEEKNKKTYHLYVVIQNSKQSIAKKFNPAKNKIEQDFISVEAANTRAEELEAELVSAKINLHAALEDLQTSNEELVTTNAELLATNEELQSSNEELSSVNEELITVNSEYDRKNQELGILNQEHRNLLRNLDTGFVFIDRDLLIKRFNKSVCKNINLLDRDLERSFQDINYPLEPQRLIIKEIKNVLSGKNSEEKELFLENGVCLVRRVLPYFGHKRAIEGVILTFTDISEIKSFQQKLDQALLASNLIWWEWEIPSGKFSLHSIGECILEFDCNEYYTHVDDWWKIVHPDDLDRVRNSLDEHIKNPEFYWNCQHRFLTKNKKWKWVQNSGQIIDYHQDGKPFKMAGTTQDISHLLQQQDGLLKTATNKKEKAYKLLNEAQSSVQELRKLAKELENANRAKSEFLSMMSHEIRTPLNPIIGLTELLLEENHPPKQKMLLKTIHKSGINLLDIISEILDFSKIESNTVELKTVKFNIIKLINECVSLLKNKCLEKSLHLEFLWENHKKEKIEKDFLVMGDPNKFLQIINNLVSNAIKFTQEGKILIKCRQKKLNINTSEFEIIVKDTGIGIDKKDRDKIFDPFSQLDNSSTRSYEGTGLGLSICKKLVEAMNGEITFHSKINKGSEFVVKLDLHNVSARPKSPILADNLNKTVNSKERILLVEDNIDNRTLVCALLGKNGYQVDEAVNGLEALEAFQNYSYKKVLMDLKMPLMDGLKATRKIRERYGNDVFIIGLTAHVGEKKEEILLKSGVDSLLFKPFSPRKLIDLLHPENITNTCY